MNVLLLGSNGYIGQNVYLHFRNKGARVRCLDLQPRCVRQDAVYEPVDVTDAASLQNVDWHVDAVIYLAGLTGTRASNENPVRFTQVNEVGLQQTLAAMMAAQSRAHFIYPSTRLVYKGGEAKLKEQDEKECRTVYAINKLSCELLLAIHARAYSLKYTCLRICVPYGSLEGVAYSYGTVGFLMKQASEGEIVLYGDGRQRRTFTHVCDIAAIMHSVIERSALVNNVYNVGGEDFSLQEVAGLISCRTGCRVRNTPWPHEDLAVESGDTVFDDSKLQAELGHAYQHSMGSWLDGVYPPVAR
jgi:UDP-glucose 4-epimerase